MSEMAWKEAGPDPSLSDREWVSATQKWAESVVAMVAKVDH